MAIHVEIDKKYVFVIFGVIILFTTMIYVFGAGAPKRTHSANQISGTFRNASYTFPGSVTVSGTGGNVPHGCYKKTTHSASASELLVTCGAGEIAVGGAGTCTSYIIRASRSSGITRWNVVCGGVGDMSAYAVCCKI